MDYRWWMGGLRIQLVGEIVGRSHSTNSDMGIANLDEPDAGDVLQGLGVIGLRRVRRV
jgi:hypothetical protein